MMNIKIIIQIKSSHPHPSPLPNIKYPSFRQSLNVLLRLVSTATAIIAATIISAVATTAIIKQK